MLASQFLAKSLARMSSGCHQSCRRRLGTSGQTIKRIYSLESITENLRDSTSLIVTVTPAKSRLMRVSPKRHHRALKSSEKR